MTGQLAIEVRGLKKCFRRELLRSEYTTWKTLFLKPFKKRLPKDLITVLDGLDLSVSPGRTLAIIGQNGSGKSTLLKIMAGIYKPDAGEVKVTGRVSSLIELGAGFHPEFTGRENVFLNGAILGMSKKEIAARFEEIVAYAGLGEYIDAPVRTYSSGMYVRLGFSVAVKVDPDVLLVDEVLAVGDEAFANKCEDKIKEFRRSGKTICLVTHDLAAVEKFADEVIWLDGGCIAAQGEPIKVIDAYRQKVAVEEDAIRREQCAVQDMTTKNRWGDGKVKIQAVRILDKDSDLRTVFQTGEAMAIEMDYQVMDPPLEQVVFGVGFFNAEGVICYGCNTLMDRFQTGPPPERGTVRFSVERMDLLKGTYFLNVAAETKDALAHDYITQAASFAMRSHGGDDGVFRPPHTWALENTAEKE